MKRECVHSVGAVLIVNVLEDINNDCTSLVISEFDTIKAIKKTNQSGASGCDYIIQPMLEISKCSTAKFWTVIFQMWNNAGIIPMRLK